MKTLRFLIPLFALAACPPVMPPVDACDANPCTGDRSVCTDVGGVASCSCRAGFQDVNGSCVQPGACANNPCTEPNRTTCVATGSTAVCRCDSGFIENAQGMCVRAQSCQPNPCSTPNKSVCSESNGTVSCACDVGFRDDGAGGCIADDPCAGNPCSEPNRGVCVAQGMTAVCRCNQGFIENNQGVCVATQSCNPNPCTIPGKSVCAVNNGVVACSCDVGLRDDGMGNCVSTSPCANNPCTQPNRGVCVAQGNTAVCQCDSGFVDDGTGTCVRPPSCNPNPCTQPNRTQCSDTGGIVVCACNAGYRLDAAGQCVPMQACNPNPCTQPNRGVCSEQSGVAVCGCNVGYRDQGGLCVPDDACDPNPCTQPNRGVCTSSNGTAICGCNPGFQDNNGACVVVDVCAPNPCTQPNRGVCSAVNGAAVCGCNAGFREENGACVALDACNPNPCTQPNRNVCVSGADAGVTCACNTGYQLGNNGCELIPAPTCTNQHTAGDMYEPDECPSLATPIVSGVPQQHTFAPEFDLDWVKFTADAGTVVAAEELGPIFSQLSLYGGPDGGVALATNHANDIHMKLPYDGTYFLQVRASVGTITGANTISVVLSQDDYVDGPDAGTVVFTPPMNSSVTVNGRFDFDSDVDCFAVPVQAGRLYDFEETTAADIELTVHDTTGVLFPRTNREWVTFKAATTGPVFVCIESFSYGIEPWTMAISDVGVDDHADSPTDNPATMTPSATPGTSVTGKFDFIGDDDCLAVPVQAGHIYTFTDASTADVYISIYTATGTHTSRTSNNTVRFRANSSQTLYFCAEAALSVDLVNWTLRVTDLGTDDHADSRDDNPATMTPTAAPGTSVTGQFNFPGDVDCLAVPVQAERIYWFAQTSSTDVYTAIYTATGTFIANTDGESHRFKSSTAQTLYFCTRAYVSSSTANWTLRVIDEGTDDFVNSRSANPTTLTPVTTPGASITGKFQYAYDSECFAVPVQANRVYTFAETTSNVDVYLTVYTATGTFISQTDSESVRFETSTAETLFLCTQAYDSSSLATWTLRVTDEGADDHADSRNDNPSTLTPGSSVSGQFNYANDTDCLAVPVLANHGYTFEETTSMDVYLTVYTATTTLISTTDNESVAFKATANDTLFLCTRAYSAATGAWTLRVIDNGEDDHADARTGATSLTVGGAAANGALQYTGDYDYFTFTTTGALALRVVTTGVATAVRVESSTGTSIATGTGPGTLTFSVTAAGTYFVRLSPGSLGAYTVTIAN